MIEQAADRAAGSGDWKRAAALLTIMARNPELPMPARYLQTVACLKAGDATGYRAACAGMAERLLRGDPKMSHTSPTVRRGQLPSAPTPPITGPGHWPGPTTPLPGWRKIEKARPALKELVRRERQQVHDDPRSGPLPGLAGSRKAAQVLREGMSLHPMTISKTGCFSPLPNTGSATRMSAKAAAAKGRVARPNSKGSPALGPAEVEVLAAELDAAVPPPGR